MQLGGRSGGDQVAADVFEAIDVRRGHPVDSIVTAPEETDAQLLAVGGRRHHRLTSMLLGSIARGILHHATCPIDGHSYSWEDESPSSCSFPASTPGYRASAGGNVHERRSR